MRRCLFQVAIKRLIYIMSGSGTKRSRQCSILEFTSSNKRPCSSTSAIMESGKDKTDPEMREKIASAALKRATSVTSSGVDPTLENSQQDMFSDNEENKSQGAEGGSWSPIQEDRKEESYKGTPIKELFTKPDCVKNTSPKMSTVDHAILFKHPFIPDEKPEPYPKLYIDKWHPDYVYMPCSPENKYPKSVGREKQIVERWPLIQDALRAKIRNSHDLERQIKMYNTRQWDFDGLHDYFQFMDEGERTEIFKKTIPKMVVLALDIRKYCTQGIPLLKANKNRSITMTQHQAACLLANAFFCTFPRRNTRKRDSEFANYPDINFSSLFSRGSRYNTRKAEKLHCIFHYFKRVTDEMPQGTITFRRQVIDHHKCPNWASSDKPLTRLHVTSKGTIEDDGKGMLQVDFANKFLGGGVLGHGCVQEEIRFLICPELILSKLVTEKLDAHECLIMTGCMRFSNYTGYADSFKWNGDHFEVPERDAWGRVNTEVVAIDALVFHQYNDQFKTGLVKRELNKAYAGFYAGPDIPEDNNPAVATGNWGCGAFGGDLRLKALIQIMAAAEANRDVCYFTFGDNKLRDDMFEIHKYFKDRDLKVGDVYSYILQYNRNYCQKYAKPKKNLFQYILKAEQSGSETEEENEAETPIITLDDSDDESKVWEKLPADLESIEKLGPDKSSSGNVGSYTGQSGSNVGHNLDEHEAMEVDGVDASQTSSKDSYSDKRNTKGHVKHKVDSDDGSSSP